ncbi:MAG TPA: hypothetical protein VFG83_11545 [Kofleriaceae bacterium]|nr:hypothetical protein [Kofleriaceae bacterium]
MPPAHARLDDTIPDPACAWDEAGPDGGDPTLDLVEPITTTLKIAAGTAFDLFCDVARIPEWLSVVRKTRVLARTAAGYPQRASFLGMLENGAVGYTLRYAYDLEALKVTWQTDAQSSLTVAGSAQFCPLSPTSCMAVYALSLSLPDGALPPWNDPFFDGHAASTVLTDFRDFIHRQP